MRSAVFVFLVLFVCFCCVLFVTILREGFKEIFCSVFGVDDHGNILRL